MPAQSAAQQVDMAPPAFLSLRPVLFVIAGLFSATFTAAGTAVLIYSLDIKRPIPPQIIFGFVAVFILIFTLLSITLLVHHALTVRKAKKEHACLHTQLHTHDVVELEDAPTQVQNPVSNDEGALTQMRNPVLNDGFERQKLNQPERPRKIHIAELDTAKREVYRRNGVHEEPYPPTPTPELRGGPYQVGAKSTGITQVNGERHNKLQSQKQKNPQSLRIQVPAPKVMHRIIESSPLPVSMIPTESELEEHRIREQRKKEERQSQNSNAEVAHQLPKLTSFPSPLFNNVDWGNQSDSVSPLTTDPGQAIPKSKDCYLRIHLSTQHTNSQIVLPTELIEPALPDSSKNSKENGLRTTQVADFLPDREGSGNEADTEAKQKDGEDVNRKGKEREKKTASQESREKRVDRFWKKGELK